MSDLTINYHGGDENSAAAAKRAQNCRVERLAAVLTHLSRAEDRGMTSEELENATGISHQSMGGLIISLIESKLIHRPGVKRKTSTGAKAWVCYLGPGENVGRPPRNETDYAKLLQRFADAFAKGTLEGAQRDVAVADLVRHGFRGLA